MMKELYEQARDLIYKSEKILIISHRRPDADTLGSAVAVKLWLDQLSKDSVLACVDKPSAAFRYLSHIDDFVNEFELSEFDLVIIVDAGASYMTNFHLKYPDLFTSSVPIINIDHHTSNDMFGTINIVDYKAASATVIIYKFFKYIGVEIDEGMATALIGGIYGDTGGFMHSNTNQEVYEISAELMKFGANIADITGNLFRNRPVNMLRLWGRVLENAHVTEDKVVLSVVKEDDYLIAHSGPEQLSGVVDYLNMVPGSRFAVLINEDRKGNVKGSFRTRQEDLDLSKIASSYGGGGHPKASGFMLPGKIAEEFKYSIVQDEDSKKSLEF